MAENVVLPPAGGTNSARPNPLAGFEWPPRGEREGEREGRKGTKVTGENTFSAAEINFWLRPA